MVKKINFRKFRSKKLCFAKSRNILILRGLRNQEPAQSDSKEKPVVFAELSSLRGQMEGREMILVKFSGNPSMSGSRSR